MNSTEITYVTVSERCLLLIYPCASEQPLTTDSETRKRFFPFRRRNFLSSWVMARPARLHILHWQPPANWINSRRIYFVFCEIVHRMWEICLLYLKILFCNNRVGITQVEIIRVYTYSIARNIILSVMIHPANNFTYFDFTFSYSQNLISWLESDASNDNEGPADLIFPFFSFFGKIKKGVN